MPPSPLSLSNIRFIRENRLILDGVTWSVRPRQIAAIVGPNGCGKSTLLRLMSGYLWPSGGAIDMLGCRLGETPLEELRQRMGIVEATAVYPFDDDMTVLEVACSGLFSALSIRYHRPRKPQWERAQYVLAQVALGDRGGQRYATLSTGQRMRCLIARALVRKPELLLLDEPTAGLDLPAREAVLATMKRLHAAKESPGIVVVTHHLDELLPGTSNVLLLGADGRTVATGKPSEVLTNTNMTCSYGCPIHVLHRHGRYHAHVNPEAWEHLLD